MKRLNCGLSCAIGNFVDDIRNYNSILFVYYGDWIFDLLLVTHVYVDILMYKLVICKDITSLVGRVNDNVRDGYEPQGGLVILKTGNLCQAMFKRK